MYTGYYSQLKKYLVDGLYPVSIAGKCPVVKKREMLI